MKYTILLASLVLIFAGQCAAQWSYSYDSYVTETPLDSNGKLSQTVLVDGTTYGSCTTNNGTYWFPNCPAYHQPGIHNVLGNGGGNYPGPSQDMFDYISYQQTVTIAATAGQAYTTQTEANVYCSAGGDIWDTGNGGGPVLAYTPIQHNYPKNPLQKACWISQFFDKIGNAGTSHRAEDVVYDNGQGTGGVKPTYGDPVYAMEAGTVSKVVSNAGPASVGFPQCQGLGYPGNRVNVRDSNGYTTVYYHVLPLSGITVGTPITQGQQLGTLDNSGCQSGPHLHVGRLDPNAHPVNFTIPCTNPLPKTAFGDGLVDDDDTDVP